MWIVWLSSRNSDAPHLATAPSSDKGADSFVAVSTPFVSLIITEILRLPMTLNVLLYSSVAVPSVPGPTQNTWLPLNTQVSTSLSPGHTGLYDGVVWINASNIQLAQ